MNQQYTVYLQVVQGPDDITKITRDKPYIEVYYQHVLLSDDCQKNVLECVHG